ncbi:MAG: non-canonical purine NTP pyrophosphatase, RdgB/HAM1 family [Acidobacteria bacterium]|nr:MAG: non-canonical purine NTP pyrophosphatase, RdgB/HAM1 family [Acidobacteriota bacterium]
MHSTKRLYLASSNSGKLREFSAIAAEVNSPIELALLPGFSELAEFPEDAPTFAENAVGKALYTATITEETVCADDSGLVVPALGGQPGVHSARYARPNATGAQNIDKLLGALAGKKGNERQGYFVCALAVANMGRIVAVITNRADGVILEVPRGSGGFGYDPVFYFPSLNRTFAELSSAEKNLHSHRGKAFRRLLEVLPGML